MSSAFSSFIADLALFFGIGYCSGVGACLLGIIYSQVRSAMNAGPGLGLE